MTEPSIAIQFAELLSEIEKLTRRSHDCDELGCNAKLMKHCNNVIHRTDAGPSMGGEGIDYIIQDPHCQIILHAYSNGKNNAGPGRDGLNYIHIIYGLTILASDGYPINPLILTNTTEKFSYGLVTIIMAAYARLVKIVATLKVQEQ